MKRLKFRAWYVEREEYYDVVFMNLAEDTICVANEYDYQCISFDEVVLEQFSGHYDKSGKEIYEGDVVELWNSVTHKTTYAIIEYNRISITEQYEIDVVGNIHENEEQINEIQ